jgi:hypothetical protein
MFLSLLECWRDGSRRLYRFAIRCGFALVDGESLPPSFRDTTTLVRADTCSDFYRSNQRKNTLLIHALLLRRSLRVAAPNTTRTTPGPSV